MNKLPNEFIYGNLVLNFEVNGIGRIVGWFSSNTNPDTRVCIPGGSLDLKSALNSALDYVDGVWSY